MNWAMKPLPKKFPLGILKITFGDFAISMLPLMVMAADGFPLPPSYSRPISSISSKYIHTY